MRTKEIDIHLRTPTLLDILRLTWWLKRPHIKAYWESPKRFLTRFQKYSRYRKSEGLLQFVIVHNRSSIGYIQCARPEKMRSHWELDILLGHPRWIGRGIGQEALTLCEQYLLLHHGARSISVDPLATNHRAIRAFTKFGFESIGIEPSAQGPSKLMVKELV